MKTSPTKNKPTTKQQTRRQAERAGYRPLTTGFALPGEQAMLDKVVADLNRGCIDFALIKGDNGIEVWRKRAKAA